MSIHLELAAQVSGDSGAPSRLDLGPEKGWIPIDEAQNPSTPLPSVEVAGAPLGILELNPELSTEKPAAKSRSARRTETLSSFTKTESVRSTALRAELASDLLGHTGPESRALICIGDEVDVTNASVFGEPLNGALERGCPAVLDVADAGFIGSEGIAVLNEIAARVGGWSRCFTVHNPRPLVARLFEILTPEGGRLINIVTDGRSSKEQGTTQGTGQ